MQEIMLPVNRDILKSELTQECLLRRTNRSNNEIYIVTHHNAPNVVREIGRLREIAFRAAGGGTGRECDLDEYDLCDKPYYQLIVWCPDTEEILGGYRFLPGSEIQYDKQGQPLLATSHMFHFSPEFLERYIGETVELGRSFVTLEHQSSQRDTKSLFALDNLWDGLGALTLIIPNVKYFFGKMTMYPSFNRQARDMILYFLNKHFGDKENLVYPYNPVKFNTQEALLKNLFVGNTFKDDYIILNREVRQTGFNIPPLVNAYMGLSPTMRVFGTAVNNGFGAVEETGILIAFEEILEQKRVRHIDTFAEQHPDALSFFTDLFKKS